ncbi:hypothetical protein GCM10009647_031100 [Streptomyces sanglieri]
MPQAIRPTELSVNAISTTPATITAGNIPACSQPRIRGFTGTGSDSAGSSPADPGAAAAAVIPASYLRDRRYGLPSWM